MGTPSFETTPDDASIRSTSTTSGNYRSQLNVGDLLIDGTTRQTISIDTSTGWVRTGTASLYAGTITTGTNNSGSPTATDSGAAWTPNEWVGAVLHMTSSGIKYYIAANTATTLTLAGVDRVNTGTGAYNIYPGASFYVTAGAGGLTGYGLSSTNAVTYYLDINGGTAPGGMSNGTNYWVQYITSTIYGLSTSSDQFNNRSGAAQYYFNLSSTGSGTMIMRENRLIDYPSDGGSVLAEDTGRGYKGQGYQFSSPVDMTGKVLSVPLASNDATPTQQCVVVLIDTDGDWKSFIVNDGQNMGVRGYALIDVELSTNYAVEYGTFNPASLNRAILYTFNSSWSSNASLIIPEYYLFDRTIDVIGGTSGDPVAWEDLYNLSETDYPNQLFRQGDPGIQYQTKIGWRLGGTGTTAIYFSDAVRSIVFPPESDGTTSFRNYTPDLRFEINGASGSEITLSGSQFGRDIEYDFVVDSGDATTKTIDSNTFVRASLTAKSTDTYTACTFLQGGGITHNDATFTDCVFDNVQRTGGALVLTTTHNLVRPTFKNMADGLEIDTAGSYDISGFTFDNNTNDINVTETTGTVTINTDGFTPTYTTAGATVVITSNVQAIHSGLIDGTRVRLYNETKAVELDNSVVSGGSGYSFTLDLQSANVEAGDTLSLHATYVSGVTAKKPLDLANVVTLSGIEFITPQEDCLVYITWGLDGSSYTTKYSADYVDDEVDIILSSNFALNELGAWWAYNLTTEEGIRQFFGGMTFVDEANLLINNDVVDIRLDNTTATNIYQTDNRRLYRTDLTRPVKATTTGGGGIDVEWRSPVSLANTDAVTANLASIIATLAAITSAISSLPADVWAYSTRTLSSFGTLVADIWANVTRTITGGTVDTCTTNTDMRGTDNALLASSYTAPDNASITLILADTNELQTNQGNWLTATGFATPTDITDSQTAIISEVNANEAKIDIIDTVVDAVKAKTDNLPASPAAVGSAMTLAANAVNATSVQDGTITSSKAPALANLDATVSSRLATSGYTAPDNTSIGSIKSKTDQLNFTGTDVQSVASNMRGTDGALLSGSYTAPDNTSISAIKAKTDNLPADPATVANQNVINIGVQKASLSIPHGTDL